MVMRAVCVTTYAWCFSMECLSGYVRVGVWAGRGTGRRDAGDAKRATRMISWSRSGGYVLRRASAAVVPVRTRLGWPAAEILDLPNFLAAAWARTRSSFCLGVSSLRVSGEDLGLSLV
mmetsp:Transcript_420/g.1248  ORF Transcript_420/g.1248 Transcript_420/m.1248 type:complete len:118 (-) Transcript_420:737-1090(-)